MHKKILKQIGRRLDRAKRSNPKKYRIAEHQLARISAGLRLKRRSRA